MKKILNFRVQRRPIVLMGNALPHLVLQILNGSQLLQDLDLPQVVLLALLNALLQAVSVCS